MKFQRQSIEKYRAGKWASMFRNPFLPVLDISGMGLNYDKAGGVLSNGMTSTATLNDFEGIVRTAKPGELRFEGGRRVENLLKDSGNLAGATWKVTRNAQKNGQHMSFTAAASNSWGQYDAIYNTSFATNIDLTNIKGRSYVMSVTLSGIDGETLYVTLEMGGGLSGTRTVTLSSKPKKYSFTLIPAVDNPQWGPGVYFKRRLGYTATSVTFHGAQVEEITNQSNNNPSEYVDYDTIYNANVPGVKYFDFENGNSVDVDGIVTEAVGARFTQVKSLRHDKSSTNIITESENFSAAAWTKQNVTVGTVSFEKMIMMSEMLEVAGISQHRFSRSISVAAGDTITLSVYATRGARDFLILWINGANDGAIALAWFNLNTGVVSNSSQGVAKIVDLGNGIYRCSVTGLSIVDTSFLALIQAANTSGVKTFDGVSNSVACRVGGAQIELCAHSTSYIKTTTAAVSRSQDRIKIPLSSGNNFNHDAGILLFKFIPDYDSSAASSHKGLFAIRDGQSSVLYKHLAANLISSYDGVKTLHDSLTFAADDTILMAVAWSKRELLYTISHSLDHGKTWSNWSNSAYAGNFTEGQNINLFYGATAGNRLISSKLYTLLPAFNISETQAWIEKNAERLMQ